MFGARSALRGSASKRVDGLSLYLARVLRPIYKKTMTELDDEFKSDRDRALEAVQGQLHRLREWLEAEQQTPLFGGTKPNTIRAWLPLHDSFARDIARMPTVAGSEHVKFLHLYHFVARCEVCRHALVQ